MNSRRGFAGTDMKTDHTGSLKNELLSLGVQKSNAVLDIGCGYGEFTFIIAQKAKKVIGIDPYENSVRSACQNYKCQNISFQVGGGGDLGKQTFNHFGQFY